MPHEQSTHVVLSGCSAGGKSTLLEELARRGFTTIPEPGRRIVVEEQEADGVALPWVDLAAFAQRAIVMARDDKRSAPADRIVFFDRGLVDAACALKHATGEPGLVRLQPEDHYHAQVFLTPPWPELFAADDVRRHGIDEAIAEYERLVETYSVLDYEVIILPKITVTERADLVLKTLKIAKP